MVRNGRHSSHCRSFGSLRLGSKQWLTCSGQGEGGLAQEAIERGLAKPVCPKDIQPSLAVDIYFVYANHIVYLYGYILNIYQQYVNHMLIANLDAIRRVGNPSGWTAYRTLSLGPS